MHVTQEHSVILPTQEHTTNGNVSVSTEAQPLHVLLVFQWPVHVEQATMHVTQEHSVILATLEQTTNGNVLDRSVEEQHHVHFKDQEYVTTHLKTHVVQEHQMMEL